MSVTEIKTKEQLYKYTSKLLGKMSQEEMQNVLDSSSKVALRNPADITGEMQTLDYKDCLDAHIAMKDSADIIGTPSRREAAKGFIKLSEGYLETAANVNAQLLVYSAASVITKLTDKVHVPQDVLADAAEDARKTGIFYADLLQKQKICSSVITGFAEGKAHDTLYAGLTATAGSKPNISDYETEVFEAAVEQMEFGHDGFKYVDFYEPYKVHEVIPAIPVFHVKTADNIDIDLDDYAEKLGKADTDPKYENWAKKSVDGLFSQMYTKDQLGLIERDGINLYDTIFIDGVPAAKMFANQTGKAVDGKRGNEKLSALIVKTMLDGNHHLDIQQYKQDKTTGKMERGTILNAEVDTDLDEKFSLWRAIKRFFGIEDTKKQRLEKMNVSDLEFEDAVDRINDFYVKKEAPLKAFAPISEAVHSYEDGCSHLDEVCFRSNMTTEPNNSLENMASFINLNSEDKEQINVVHSMNRMPSRLSLIGLYLMSKGMSFEQIVSTDSALDADKKKFGKEFLDRVTFPTPEQYAKEKNPDIKPEEFKKLCETKDFKESYTTFCKEKAENVMTMYNEELFPALTQFADNLTPFDVNRTKECAENYAKFAFYGTASCDFLQSPEYNKQLDKTSELYKTIDKNTTSAMNRSYSRLVIGGMTAMASFKPSGIAPTDQEVSALATILSNKICSNIMMNDYRKNGTMSDEMLASTGIKAIGVTPNILHQINSKTPLERIELRGKIQRIIANEDKLPESMLDIDNPNFSINELLTKKAPEMQMNAKQL